MDPREVGALLRQAQPQIEPEKWEGWLKRNFKMTVAQASFLMQFGRPVERRFTDSFGRKSKSQRCTWCGSNLDPYDFGGRMGVHPNRRFCSNTCRVQHQRAHQKGPEKRDCATCGKPLPLFQSSTSTAKYVRDNRLYCSIRCRVAAHRAKAKRKGKK